MPLPDREYFWLDEIEERWGARRQDTAYYSENGLLEVAIRVTGAVIETGMGGTWDATNVADGS
ncbi:MAG TPA: hypothetical protein PLQ12_06530, partial [Candidatus Defluviicoccus seviourii]|nr:hypothetical protein [Candidatus Defluviicoccus seviourii]